jgi:hypothetical protein
MLHQEEKPMTTEELLAEVSSPNPRPEAVRACAEELRAVRLRVQDALTWCAQNEGEVPGLSPISAHLQETLAAPMSLDCITLPPGGTTHPPRRLGLGELAVKK